MRIYLSKGTCKKLCVKVIFLSYNFLEKKRCGEKNIPKKERDLLSDARRDSLLYLQLAESPSLKYTPY
jgi:hypothetical protein